MHTSMRSKIDISASIVIYNEDKSILKNTIDCFFNISKFSSKLYLIDNTIDSDYQEFSLYSNLEYITVRQNIGFGQGNNKVLTKIENESKYHLILNPDVGFEPDIFTSLIKMLEEDSDISMIAPKVLFPDRTFQNSCRRYPTII